MSYLSRMASFPTNIGDEFVGSGPREAVAVAVAGRSFRILKDSDPFPFGNYRGQRMDEVPASYLDHLRDANWLSNYPAVEEYIERCSAAIDQELERADRGRDRQY